MMKAIRPGIILLLALLAMVSPALVMAQGPEEARQEALVWQVGGVPNAPQGLGSFLWQAGDDVPIMLSDVPDEGTGTRVMPCGPDATAPDGSAMIVFVGGQTGGLYRVPLVDGGAFSRLADAHVFACNAPRRAMYSPDGIRWAYLDYDPRTVVADPSLFAGGTLHVIDPQTGNPVQRFEDTVAFALRDDGVYLVQFYTDSQGKADEAVISRWDGSGRLVEWGEPLVPAAGCNWTSAAIDVNAAGAEAIVSLGERCARSSQWRVFTLQAAGAASEHVYMPGGGGFFATSTVNQVYYLAGGTHALATYPNGRANNISNLVMIALERNTVTLITPEVTVDTFPSGMAHHMQFSPDGRFLAYVSSDANDNHALHRLRLDGGLSPLTISAGRQHDVISAFFFRPDGGLLYVAGSTSGGDNALYLLPASASNAEDTERIRRGNFLRDWGLATADHVLLLEYVAADSEQPATANLILVAYNGDERMIVTGREASNAVAYPLAWR